MNWRVVHGRIERFCTLLQYTDCKFHACLCDPPYGMEFMNHGWDYGVPDKHTWELIRSTLYPGAHIIAFGGTSTWHRLACALEDGGFEIRDTIMWVYYQGMPKGYHIGRDVEEFQDYHTLLKTAVEPIIVAMNPKEGTYAHNARKYDVAGLNIAACRIPYDDDLDDLEAQKKALSGYNNTRSIGGSRGVYGGGSVVDRSKYDPSKGRFPSNVIIDHDIQLEGSHMLYRTKASSNERDAGLNYKNTHPAIKPIDLTTYLAKLLLPPANAHQRNLLVPFSGTGSEIIGGIHAGWDSVVGVESNIDYVITSEERILYWESLK